MNANPTSISDPLIGRCLNDTYQVEGIIGEGGVGRVYRARHSRIKTKFFALKVLHPEHARDAQHLARFQQEAEAAATLSHPNVVGVYDVGRTADGYSYLACELLTGTDLDALLEKQGKLSVATVVHLGIQICDALESAHAQNIVHRDLKPQNVFLLAQPDGSVTDHPAVKLLDFGLSRFLDSTDTQLTKTGAVMGTPAFMAPEQAMGKRGDHRVDIYGVGVILYAALTGQPPFLEQTLAAMLVAVMTQEPTRPRKLVPEIPEALELVVQRAMAREADDRYQSIAEVRNALIAIQSTPSLAPPAHVPRALMASVVLRAEDTYELRTSRPRLVFYTLAAVALLISVFASALGGLELFVGPIKLTIAELVLTIAGILGTIAMPAILTFRKFREAVWSNSAKVVDALNRMRGPLTAALVTYGASAVVISFLDGFVSRFGYSDLLSPDPGLGWRGFTWILPIASFLAAGISLWKRVQLERPGGTNRRMWLGGPLWIATFALIGGILFGGIQWRARELASRPAAVTPAAVPAAPPAVPEKASEEKKPAASAPAKDLAVRAPDSALAAAIPQGVDGLLPLSEKYPGDPRVLEPLLLAFASRATGLADAMVTAERLLQVAPEKRDSEALGIITLKAAKTAGQASEKAMSLMAGPLQTSGADLLYQLSQTTAKTAAQARELLKTESVQAHMSPALRILIDLETAPDCASRLPLLDRAKQLGDLRAASFLAPLAKGSKTGCGRWKNRPCTAVCQSQARAYLDAAHHIQARLSGSQL